MNVVSASDHENRVPRKIGPVLLICLFLTIFNLLVFGNVGQFSFVFDDVHYVTENTRLHGGLTLDSIRWALTTSHAGFYHPLTWLSLLLDAELFGSFPGGYHWTNLLFHIANTLLLFLVLRRATGSVNRSGFVAALFAIHPLHVESVAWVAGRKDVLSAFFWMLTMGAYIVYAERPALSKYLMVVVFFIMGLMSKPMLVTLPLVLLCLDYWPLGRFRKERGATIKRLISEKLPLLLLSVIFSILTLYTELSFGALATFDALPWTVRVANAIVAYADYIGKMFWPVDLAVFYPYVKEQQPIKIALSGATIIAGCILAIANYEKRPFIMVGWLWYLITLLPVIGIVQVGFHARADRYTYLPLIGLFIVVVWVAAEVMGHTKRYYYRYFLAVVMAVVTISAIVTSWFQVQHWENNYSLFSHALQVTENNHLAHANLAVALNERGDYGQAVHHLEEAIRILPTYVIAHENLGRLYIARGRLDEGIGQLRGALMINPGNHFTQKHLAHALLLRKDYQEALDLYRSLLILYPDDHLLYNNLGVALVCMGRYAEGRSYFERALQINPRFSRAKANKDILDREMGR